MLLKQRIGGNENRLIKMKTVKILKTATKTEIFNFVAKKFGSKEIRKSVFDYLKSHSVYGKKVAYSIAYLPKTKMTNFSVFNSLKISDAVSYVKSQLQKEKNSYSKILIEGNSNIYWASEFYGHSDYNKSIAFEKTEKTLKVMALINSILNKKVDKKFILAFDSGAKGTRYIDDENSKNGTSFEENAKRFDTIEEAKEFNDSLNYLCWVNEI